MIVGPALARGYKLLPDFSYEPWIFDKDCTVTAQSPFTVDCTIRPEAKWSDGVPITADDFKFTYDTIMNPKNNVVTRNGYDKITAFNVRQPDRVPDGVRGGLRAVPRAVGGHEHRRAAEARPRGQELQQGLEHLHLRPEDEEADQQRPDDGAVVHARPAGHARPEPELLGQEGARCPKVVFIPITDSNSRAQRVPRR